MWASRPVKHEQSNRLSHVTPGTPVERTHKDYSLTITPYLKINVTDSKLWIYTKIELECC